jgi:arylsulfatase A-like enzyme
MEFARHNLRTYSNICFLFLGMLSIAGCGDKDAARDGNADSDGSRQAIVFMLDAARPDRFSSYGYDRETTPVMDKLADNGLLCENHFAQGTGTRASLPTTLYSRYFIMPMFPSSPNLPLTNPRDLFRRPDDQCVSLTEVMQHAGFRTTVISAHPYLKKGTRFAESFDELIDLVNTDNADMTYPPMAQVIDRTLLWLDEHQDEDFLLYVHIMDTHFPHFFGEDARKFLGRDPGPETARFRPTGEPISGKDPLSKAEMDYLNALYDGSMLYTDREIGRLVDWLDQRDKLDSTVLAITADHGEHLMEAGTRFAHLGPWYDAVARIPLIISCPDRLPAARITSQTESVDLTPTLLSLLDIDLPPRIDPDGVDLLDLAAGRIAPRDYAFMRGALRNDDWKLIVSTPDSLLLREDPMAQADISGELYDLQKDPLELNNLWSENPGQVADLLAVYRDNMLARYKRYEASQVNEQPLVSFAVGANWIEPAEDLHVIRDNPFKISRQPEHAGHWVQCRDQYKFWLLATQGAGTADFSIMVPDGNYMMVGQIFGDIAFGFQDGATYAVTGQPFNEQNYLRPRSIRIGEVSVTGGRLSFTLQPKRDGGNSLVRLLGFYPMLEGKAEMDDEAERRRIQRLKSLGYVD